MFAALGYYGIVSRRYIYAHVWMHVQLPPECLYNLVCLCAGAPSHLSLHNYSIRSTLTGHLTRTQSLQRNEKLHISCSLQYIVRGPCAGTNTHAIDMQVKEKLCAAFDAAKRDCKHFHAQSGAETRSVEMVVARRECTVAAFRLKSINQGSRIRAILR